MIEMYSRLFRAGVPVEAHFFQNGIHGTGFALGDPGTLCASAALFAKPRWPGKAARPASALLGVAEYEMGDYKATGVNRRLVEKVREALDGAGFRDVRIVVSGGFNAERIRQFEAAGVPVDAYGVGSALIRGENDFTADVVMVEGRPCAKVGRWYRPNPRLTRVH